MSNRFYELERRCIEYRRKKNIKSLFLGVIIGLILVTITFYSGLFNEGYFVDDNIDITSQSEENIYEEDSDDGYITQTTDEIMNEELGEQEELEVDNLVVKNVEDEIKGNVSIESNIVELDNIEEVEEKEVEIADKKPLFLEPKIVLDLFKKKVDKKSIKDIKDIDNPIINMEKEFSLSHSIKTALLISEYYYDKADFKSSLKWAIEASKIDAKASKPWVMYARAKSKSGDVAIAIKALQTYLSEFYSDEASLLLDELKNIKRTK